MIWFASLLVILGDYSLAFLEKVDDFEKSKQLLHVVIVMM